MNQPPDSTTSQVLTLKAFEADGPRVQDGKEAVR